MRSRQSSIESARTDVAEVRRHAPGTRFFCASNGASSWLLDLLTRSTFEQCDSDAPGGEEKEAANRKVNAYLHVASIYLPKDPLTVRVFRNRNKDSNLLGCKCYIFRGTVGHTKAIFFGRSGSTLRDEPSVNESIFPGYASYTEFNPAFVKARVLLGMQYGVQLEIADPSKVVGFRRGFGVRFERLAPDHISHFEVNVTETEVIFEEPARGAWAHVFPSQSFTEVEKSGTSSETLIRLILFGAKIGCYQKFTVIAVRQRSVMEAGTGFREQRKNCDCTVVKQFQHPRSLECLVIRAKTLPEGERRTENADSAAPEVVLADSYRHVPKATRSPLDEALRHSSDTNSCNAIISQQRCNALEVMADGLGIFQNARDVKARRNKASCVRQRSATGANLHGRGLLKPLHAQKSSALHHPRVHGTYKHNQPIDTRGETDKQHPSHQNLHPEWTGDFGVHAGDFRKAFVTLHEVDEIAAMLTNGQVTNTYLGTCRQPSKTDKCHATVLTNYLVFHVRHDLVIFRQPSMADHYAGSSNIGTVDDRDAIAGSRGRSSIQIGNRRKVVTRRLEIYKSVCFLHILISAGCDDSDEHGGDDCRKPADHRNDSVTTFPEKTSLTYTCKRSTVHDKGFKGPVVDPSAFPRTQRVAPFLHKKSAHMGAECPNREAGSLVDGLTAVNGPLTSAPSIRSKRMKRTQSVRSTAMAHDHVREDASASPLELSVPGPIAGDPWTYLSSNPNAALAIAGAYEAVDDQSVTDVQADLMSSPQYQLAVTSLERDLEWIETQKLANAKERRRFALDLFAARLYLGGTLQHRIALEVQDAA